MKFKPFDVKFSDERLNKPVKLPQLNAKLCCNSHHNLSTMEQQGDNIFCRNCGQRLKLVPAWIISD